MTPRTEKMVFGTYTVYSLEQHKICSLKVGNEGRTDNMRSIFRKCVVIAVTAAIALAWHSPPVQAQTPAESDIIPTPAKPSAAPAAVPTSAATLANFHTFAGAIRAHAGASAILSQNAVEDAKLSSQTAQIHITNVEDFKTDADAAAAAATALDVAANLAALRAGVRLMLLMLLLRRLLMLRMSLLLVLRRHRQIG